MSLPRCVKTQTQQQNNTLERMSAMRPQCCLLVCVCVNVCICVFDTLLSTRAPVCSFSEGERRGSGAQSAERPLATMPAQSLQHFGTPVACYSSLSLSASRLSPNPHLFLSASIFLSSERVCPYSQDISSPCRRGAAVDCKDPQ